MKKISVLLALLGPIDALVDYIKISGSTPQYDGRYIYLKANDNNAAPIYRSEHPAILDTSDLTSKSYLYITKTDKDSVVGESEDFWTLSTSTAIDSEYFLKMTSSSEFPFYNAGTDESDTKVIWAGFDDSKLVIASVDDGYCAEGENYCTNGDCIIRSGKRVCLCLPGYTLTSKTVCEDFDECALQADNCPSSKTCFNTPGSYYCAEPCESNKLLKVIKGKFSDKACPSRYTINGEVFRTVGDATDMLVYQSESSDEFLCRTDRGWISGPSPSCDHASCHTKLFSRQIDRCPDQITAWETIDFQNIQVDVEEVEAPDCWCGPFGSCSADRMECACAEGFYLDRNYCHPEEVLNVQSSYAPEINGFYKFKNSFENGRPLYRHVGSDKVIRYNQKWIVSSGAKNIIEYYGKDKSPVTEERVLQVAVHKEVDYCSSGLAPCAGSSDYFCLNKLGGFTCAPKFLSFEDGASSPLSRYRIRNMQLVEGVSYAGQNEYPVYGDLGNKFGSERLFVVKHNIKDQWKLIDENMFSSDDALAIFSVQGSDSSSVPVGETRLIWPSGKPFRLEIPTIRYCPHYFKTFSASGFESPCPRETPICKFSGNGGYNCCDRVKNCPTRACDAAKGEILKSGRCVCMDKFVSTADGCKYESSRRSEIRRVTTTTTTTAPTRNYRFGPMMRAGGFYETTMETVTAPVVRLKAATPRPTISSGWAANPFDFCFGAGCKKQKTEEIPNVRVRGKSPPTKAPRTSRKSTTRKPSFENHRESIRKVLPGWNPAAVEVQMERQAIVKSMNSDGPATIRQSTDPEKQKLLPENTDDFVILPPASTVEETTTTTSTTTTTTTTTSTTTTSTTTTEEETTTDFSTTKEFTTTTEGTSTTTGTTTTTAKYSTLELEQTTTFGSTTSIGSTTTTMESTTTLASTTEAVEITTTISTTTAYTTTTMTTTDFTTLDTTTKYATVEPVKDITTTMLTTTTTLATTTSAQIAAYSQWTEWSECTGKCPSGVQTRARLCEGALCKLPIESERRSCDILVCAHQDALMKDALSEQDYEYAMNAIKEENLKLLQIILYNHNFELMVVDFMAPGEKTIPRLLDNFFKVESIRTTRKMLEAELMEPRQVRLKSASFEPEIVVEENQAERIRKIEADYIIGKLLKSHLASKVKK